MSKFEPFAMQQEFVPCYQNQPQKETGKGLWFIFAEDQLLIAVDGNEQKTLPGSPEDLGLTPCYQRFFGQYGKTPCFLAEIRTTAAPANTDFIGLRPLFGKLDQDIFALAGQALQLLRHWHASRYCSRCGTPLNESYHGLGRTCPSCDFIHFPPISPAVIMAVVDEKRILLARASRYPKGMYSTLAGFVEPGETLEEAVRREVLEETAIHLSEISYVASQPWPFPNSIMIGFMARYESGTIVADKMEIEDARWFTRDTLPRLPSKMTIARHLIDRFAKGLF